MSIFKNLQTGVLEVLNVGLQDDDMLRFGTGKDVTVEWDATKLEILPVAHDTGAINVGNGTTDIDLKVFLGSANEYVLFDVGNSRLDIGKDATGLDAKFYGVTTGAYAEWDSSADRLNIVTVAARAITGEEHALDVTMGGTLSSGDGMVGGNFAVTTSGAAAAWVSGIYAKVTQGATKNVNGYISGAEFEVVNSADNVSDNFVLVLNSNNSGAQRGSHESYVALRSYGTLAANSLLWLSTDHTIGTNDATVLVSTTAAKVQTHAVRCIVGATPIWLMATTTAPAA